MAEVFDFANWFSAKEKLVCSRGQHPLNLGDGGAACCRELEKLPFSQKCRTHVGALFLVCVCELQVLQPRAKPCGSRVKPLCSLHGLYSHLSRARGSQLMFSGRCRKAALQ